MAQSHQPPALTRFLNFTLSLLHTSNPQRPQYANYIEQEWRAKPTGAREYIDHLIQGLEEISYQTGEQLQLAIQARNDVDQISVRQPRAIVKQLRVYVEELQKLQRQRETCQAIHQSFVDNEIGQAGFGEEVKALCALHVQLWAQRDREARQLILETENEISSIRGRPGGNSRKVPYAIDKKGIKLRLNESVKSFPFEHQHQHLHPNHKEEQRKQRQSLIPAGNWLPARILGQSMACACLWVDVDPATNTIQNRIVRKDTHMPGSAMADNTRWHGDFGDLYNRVPMEFHCQRKLQFRPEAQDVVLPALKCEMPFCPYGDLEDLISTYDKLQRHAGNLDPSDTDPYGFPEPFLWRVFQALVEAGMLMERGGVYQPVRDGSWLEIVHRDLKDPNVFLDLEPGEGNPWPWYPRIKLADFGLAIETHARDPLNPLVYTGPGTRGYQAPEQLTFMDSETGARVEKFKILAHTNVWGVGAIMWTLCNRTFIGDVHRANFVPTSAAKGLFNDVPKYEIPKGYMWYAQSRHFSPVLKKMVEGCMRFDPADRPTFPELYQAIGQFMTDNGRDGGPGRATLLAARGHQPLPQEDPYAVFGLEDRGYRIGLAYPGPPMEGRSEPRGASGSRTVNGGATDESDDGDEEEDDDSDEEDDGDGETDESEDFGAPMERA